MTRTEKIRNLQARIDEATAARNNSRTAADWNAWNACVRRLIATRDDVAAELYERYGVEVR